MKKEHSKNLNMFYRTGSRPYPCKNRTFKKKSKDSRKSSPAHRQKKGAWEKIKG
jgi:hypothetical protein